MQFFLRYLRLPCPPNRGNFIFPNEESALRLIRALAVEIHEDWIEAHRYLNMEMLREQRKQLQLLEAA